MKVLVLISTLLISQATFAAGGTLSRDPASAADDLAAESVDADQTPSDYESATHIVTLNIKPFQGCFNAEVAKHPGLSGNATMSWKITPKGDATEIHFAKSDIKSPTFEPCMVREFAKLKFAPPSPKMVQPFTYPFLFVSSKTSKKY